MVKLTPDSAYLTPNIKLLRVEAKEILITSSTSSTTQLPELIWEDSDDYNVF